MTNLVITGIPRAGTSLAAAIIDAACDSLCFSEPEGHVDLMRAAADQDEFVRSLAAEFDRIRRAVITGIPIKDRRDASGSLLTNYFAPADLNNNREMIGDFREVNRRDLSSGFVLGVKHNALYTAVLPALVQSGRFCVLAIVRDPVAVVTSWRSLRLPVSIGRLPAAERFWPRMAALTQAEIDLTEKQIRIHDLICRRFARWADRIVVVRYEALSGDPAILLHAAGFPASRYGRATTIVRNAAAPAINDDFLRDELTAQIRLLASAGQLAGIGHYYPEYGSAG